MPKSQRAPDSSTQALSSESRNELRKEAEYLYRRLFGREASTELIENYLAAHAQMPALYMAPEAQFNTVRTIVAKELDAVAIEPWMRSRKVRHVLSRKLLLISYLAECDSRHPEYMRSSGGVTEGWPRFLLTGLQAGFSLARGRYLKARYGLV